MCVCVCVRAVGSGDTHKAREKNFGMSFKRGDFVQSLSVSTRAPFTLAVKWKKKNALIGDLFIKWDSKFQHDRRGFSPLTLYGCT